MVLLEPDGADLRSQQPRVHTVSFAASTSFLKPSSHAVSSPSISVMAIPPQLSLLPPVSGRTSSWPQANFL